MAYLAIHAMIPSAHKPIYKITVTSVADEEEYTPQPQDEDPDTEEGKPEDVSFSNASSSTENSDNDDASAPSSQNASSSSLRKDVSATNGKDEKEQESSVVESKEHDVSVSDEKKTDLLQPKKYTIKVSSPVTQPSPIDESDATSVELVTDTFPERMVSTLFTIPETTQNKPLFRFKDATNSPVRAPSDVAHQAAFGFPDGSVPLLPPQQLPMVGLSPLGKSMGMNSGPQYPRHGSGRRSAISPYAGARYRSASSPFAQSPYERSAFAPASPSNYTPTASNLYSIISPRKMYLRTPRGTRPKIEAPNRFIGETSYRQTVVFLLAMACNRIFPDRQLVVQCQYEFCLTRRSYLCRFTAPHKATRKDIKMLNEEMHLLAKKELHLKAKEMKFKQCVQFFTQSKQMLSLKLVESLNRPQYHCVYCRVDEHSFFMTLQHRPLLSNTKYLHKFEIFPMKDGTFVLAFPDTDDLNKPITKPRPSSPLMSTLYKQGFELGVILGVQCVGDLNEKIKNGQFKEIILLAEGYHSQQIVNISEEIAGRPVRPRIILVGGPSSSGKTTFTSKLVIQLRLHNIEALKFDLNRYFKSHSDPTYPHTSSGELDFDHIDAMRMDLVHLHLDLLLKGEPVMVPSYDFRNGMVIETKEVVTLAEDSIILLEGVFAFHPALTEPLKEWKPYRILVSAIACYNFDNLNFLAERVIRVIRRIARDSRDRGLQAEGTLFRWGTVERGEEMNLYPYIEDIDSVFNASLIYEVPLLTVFCKPLLHTIQLSSPQNKDARNLINFLDGFLAMPDSAVPSTSTVMEFIGKSIFLDI